MQTYTNADIALGRTVFYLYRSTVYFMNWQVDQAMAVLATWPKSAAADKVHAVCRQINALIPVADMICDHDFRPTA